MAWVLSPREKRALLLLLRHSPCTTFQIAFGMGHGTAPTSHGVPEGDYRRVQALLHELRKAGAAQHFRNRWEVTEKGRIAAALIMVKEPALQAVAA